MAASITTTPPSPRTGVRVQHPNINASLLSKPAYMPKINRLPKSREHTKCCNVHSPCVPTQKEIHVLVHVENRRMHEYIHVHICENNCFAEFIFLAKLRPNIKLADTQRERAK